MIAYMNIASCSTAAFNEACDFRQTCSATDREAQARVYRDHLPLKEHDRELRTGNTGRKLSMFEADRSTLQSRAQFVVFRFDFCTVGGVCGTERQHDDPSARFTTRLKMCDFLLVKACETSLNIRTKLVLRHDFIFLLLVSNKAGITLGSHGTNPQEEEERERQHTPLKREGGRRHEERGGRRRWGLLLRAAGAGEVGR